MSVGTRRTLIGIAALSLAVRLVFLVFFGRTFFDTGRMIPLYDLAANWADTGRFVSDDEFVTRAFQHSYNLRPKTNVDYLELRRAITTPRTYNPSPEITDTWGYAALLGAIWKLTGVKSLIFIQVLQALLDTAATVLVFVLLLALYADPRLAAAGALGYALFPPFAFMAVIGNREYYAAWGAMLSLFLFVKGLRSLGGRRLLLWLGSGLAIALFSWFRPTIVLLPAAYACLTLVADVKQRALVALRAAALIGLPVAALFVIPYSLQYHAKYGTYDFSSGLRGVALWEMLGKYSHKYHFRWNDYLATQRAWELGYPREAPLFTPAYGRLLEEDCWKVIRRDPLFYASTILRNFVRYSFARPPFPLSERHQISFDESGHGLAAFARKHPVFFAEKLVKAAVTYAVPVLALLAVGLFPRARRQSFMLLAVWQYGILTLVHNHLEDRYVMGTYFPVVALATMSAYELWRRLRVRFRALSPESTAHA